MHFYNSPSNRIFVVLITSKQRIRFSTWRYSTPFYWLTKKNVSQRQYKGQKGTSHSNQHSVRNLRPPSDPVFFDLLILSIAPSKFRPRYFFLQNSLSGLIPPHTRRGHLELPKCASFLLMLARMWGIGVDEIFFESYSRIHLNRIYGIPCNFRPFL